MHGISEEQKAFESMKAELLKRHLGCFALVCGSRLLGVFESVEAAFSACSRAFDAGELPDGAPVLVSEIAEEVSLRVMARPYSHPGATPARAP